MTSDLEGPIAAAVTPRNRLEEIDFGAAFELIDFLSCADIDGIALFTAVGEYPSLATADRGRFLYLAVKRSRAPLFAGIGAATLDSIAFPWPVRPAMQAWPPSCCRRHISFATNKRTSANSMFNLALWPDRGRRSILWIRPNSLRLSNPRRSANCSRLAALPVWRLAFPRLLRSPRDRRGPTRRCRCATRAGAGFYSLGAAIPGDHRAQSRPQLTWPEDRPFSRSVDACQTA